MREISRGKKTRNDRGKEIGKILLAKSLQSLSSPAKEAKKSSVAVNLSTFDFFPLPKCEFGLTLSLVLSFLCFRTLFKLLWAVKECIMLLLSHCDSEQAWPSASQTIITVCATAFSLIAFFLILHRFFFFFFFFQIFLSCRRSNDAYIFRKSILLPGFYDRYLTRCISFTTLHVLSSRAVYASLAANFEVVSMRHACRVFPSQDGSGYLGEVQDPSPFLNGFAAVLPLLHQLANIWHEEEIVQTSSSTHFCHSNLVNWPFGCHLKNLEFKLLSSLEDCNVFTREIRILLLLSWSSISTPTATPAIYKWFFLHWVRALVYSRSASISGCLMLMILF